jgi:hypothetical protein
MSAAAEVPNCDAAGAATSDTPAPAPDDGATDTQSEAAAVPDSAPLDGGDKSTDSAAVVAALAFALVYPPFRVGRSVNPKLLVQLLGACVILFTFAWLYIGAAWDPHLRLRSLSVAVLSCDAGVPPALAPALPPAFVAAPPLGAALLASSLFDPTSRAASLLGWRTFQCGAAAGGACGVTAATADACRAELVRAVERGDVWSALYVPRGFTAAVLSHAPAFGMNATGATMEHIYGSGRSTSTYTFIKALVVATSAGMSSALGASVLANAALGAAMSKSFFLAPFTLVATDLHPVIFFGQHFATYVLCVLLWMGSAFVASLTYQYKTRAEVDALRNARRITVSEALRTIAAKSLLATCFSFLQAISLVSVMLCLGGYHAGAGAHHGCQWAHNPGRAIAYGAYMAWSFLSINALCLHVFGVERFTAITTCARARGDPRGLGWADLHCAAVGAACLAVCGRAGSLLRACALAHAQADAHPAAHLRGRVLLGDAVQPLLPHRPRAAVLLRRARVPHHLLRRPGELEPHQLDGAHRVVRAARRQPRMRVRAGALCGGCARLTRRELHGIAGTWAVSPSSWCSRWRGCRSA